jgi:hypothetical protein
MSQRRPMGEPIPEDEAPHTPTCPWCAFTDVLLKKVLNHMESAHALRWCDLALSPLIAGDGPV